MFKAIIIFKFAILFILFFPFQVKAEDTSVVFQEIRQVPFRSTLNARTDCKVGEGGYLAGDCDSYKRPDGIALVVVDISWNYLTAEGPFDSGRAVKNALYTIRNLPKNNIATLDGNFECTNVKLEFQSRGMRNFLNSTKDTVCKIYSSGPQRAKGGNTQNHYFATVTGKMEIAVNEIKILDGVLVDLQGALINSSSLFATGGLEEIPHGMLDQIAIKNARVSELTLNTGGSMRILSPGIIQGNVTFRLGGSKSSLTSTGEPGQYVNEKGETLRFRTTTTGAEFLLPDGTSLVASPTYISPGLCSSGGVTRTGCLKSHAVILLANGKNLDSLKKYQFGPLWIVPYWGLLKENDGVKKDGFHNEYK